MRLIDADAFCAFLREVSTRQHYETLLTHKDKYPTVADVIEAVCCDLDGTSLQGFDNAPTVEAYTEEDIKETIKENFDIGYGMAKAKFERPKGKWIVKSNGTTNYYACDKCGSAGDIQDKFCRECGASMKGGAE